MFILNSILSKLEENIYFLAIQLKRIRRNNYNQVIITI